MRVEFQATGSAVPPERLERNVAYSRALGLPHVRTLARGSRALNIIGRGPSVLGHIDRLRHDISDKWACGTAWPWCRDNGIGATFVCADPSPVFAGMASGTAILADQCDPSVFGTLDAYLFDPNEDAAGTTTACAAVTIAATIGYKEIRLYGCEGSFGERTHADEDQPQRNPMVVRCNCQEFLTNPQMIMQSECIAEAARAAPDFLIDRSGGLLGALIACPDWELIRWDNAPEKVRRLMREAE